ncbi:MAG TPA: ABC transporter ATP-binding protein [Polyangiaceae bacterium]|nr:ABC transporter ATP-binding protein [Polyangiaceae bacterium]
MNAPASISLREVELQFGEGKMAVQALRGLNLDIPPGEFVSVLGPSGCGKSSLIGAIAGLTRVSSGEVSMDGSAVRAPSSERGVVFQQHTLFPWKTVLDNVAFGLKMRGVAKAERQRAAREILAHVGLEAFADHYPEQLSGGMQQRVNLARVLLTRPRVLLMDEPFCALDAQARLNMQQLLLGLWQQFPMTVLFVTHDVDEAIFLSDRFVVLSERPGRILADVAVPLARPRSHELLTSTAFTELKRRALDLLVARGRPRLAGTSKEPASRVPSRLAAGA